MVNLTPIYGGFNSYVMSVMKDLVDMDVSGCRKLNTDDFVESIVDAFKVEKLNISGCTQFTEQQIIDICTCLPNLVSVDATGCTGLQFANALTILCNI